MLFCTAHLGCVCQDDSSGIGFSVDKAVASASRVASSLQLDFSRLPLLESLDTSSVPGMDRLE